jgi:hypothetical protein
MIYIVHGSIFDTKCDLLVLPCDSFGGVTSWVQQEIHDHSLPKLARKIPFGKAYFIIPNDKYEKSTYICYAASVNAQDTSSNLKAIKSIINDIVLFCDSNKCSIINIPVLGTGAGRLDYNDVIDLYKGLLTKLHIEVHVFIPDYEIARLFIEDNGKTAKDTIEYTNPRVFISYCQKDKKIEAWTTNIAAKLRQNGVDAILDKFNLKPGMDLPQWMTNEIIKAQKVLLICDKNYADRADIRKAGVGWETMIIQGDMLIQGENSSKYIAIACDGFDINVPIYIKTKLGITKEEIDSDFNTLLVSIFELDIAPELGKIPKWVMEKMGKRNIA